MQRRMCLNCTLAVPTATHHITGCDITKLCMLIHERCDACNKARYTTMCVWLTSCIHATPDSAQPATNATAYSIVQSHWQCKLLPGNAKQVQASCSAHCRFWQEAGLLGSGYAPSDRHSACTCSCWLPVAPCYSIRTEPFILGKYLFIKHSFTMAGVWALLLSYQWEQGTPHL